MRNEVKAVLARVKEIRDTVQGYLNNVKEGEDEREERLSSEVDSLDQAIEALEGIE